MHFSRSMGWEDFDEVWFLFHESIQETFSNENLKKCRSNLWEEAKNWVEDTQPSPLIDNTA